MSLKRRLCIIFLLVFLPLHYLTAANQPLIPKDKIDVVHLYTPKPDEKPISDFLFPLSYKYFKNVISEYNKDMVSAGKSQKQVQKVFISQIYRSRAAQRQEFFDYIVKKKGFFNFFSLYDSQNEQFAVQLMHIIMPLFVSTSSTQSLTGRINDDLDTVLNGSFVKVPTDNYISSSLINIFALSKGTSYASSRTSIEAIASDALKTFNIQASFIDIATKDISKKLKSKFGLTDAVAKKLGEQNFLMSVAKSVFQYLTPKIKVKGDALFADPKIGSALTTWFKTAPAYTHHSISDLTDDELNDLPTTLKSGKNVTFAVDLGIQTNKALDGSTVWNYSTSGNTLKTLKTALEKSGTVMINPYSVTFKEDNMLMGKSELAVHIELIITYAPTNLPTTPTVNPSPSEVKQDTANEEDDSKTFETPNKDSNSPEDNKIKKKFNYDKYNNVLGKAHSGATDKQFEIPKGAKTANDDEQSTNSSPTPEAQTNPSGNIDPSKQV